MKSFLEQVAARLRAEIPGLTVRVDADHDELQLYGRYRCPCGELSGFVQSFSPEYMGKDLKAIAFIVECLKHMLRAHVRGEGNEPNF